MWRRHYGGDEEAVLQLECKGEMHTKEEWQTPKMTVSRNWKLTFWIFVKIAIQTFKHLQTSSNIFKHLQTTLKTTCDSWTSEATNEGTAAAGACSSQCRGITQQFAEQWKGSIAVVFALSVHRHVSLHRYRSEIWSDSRRIKISILIRCSWR